MPRMTKDELNAVLELLKRHAQAVSKEAYINDIDAMQSKLDSKKQTTEKTSANPES